MMMSGVIPSQEKGMSWEGNDTNMASLSHCVSRLFIPNLHQTTTSLTSQLTQPSHTSPASHPTHLLPVLDATRALLPVSAGKLVPNLRDPDRAHFDLAELVALLVHRHHHLATPHEWAVEVHNTFPSHSPPVLTWSIMPVSLLLKNVLASFLVYLFGPPSSWRGKGGEGVRASRWG